MVIKRKRTVKKVLIYRLGSLGDTVIALPALHLTARTFPEADRRMLTSFPPNVKAPPSSAILDHTGLVHGYFRYSYGTRQLRELAILWWKLTFWRPDVLVYMSGPRGIAAAKRDALFFRLCFIRHQIGVSITEDMQQRRPQAEEGFKSQYVEGLPLEYECSRLVRNLAKLGDASLDDPSNWDLRFTLAEKSKADDIVLHVGARPLIAASIGTKMQSKDWGRDNWRAVVRSLAQRYPDHALVLCGAAEEFEASEHVNAGWQEVSTNPSLNVCGVLSPRESAAVFARAVIFIGHDSGPMHLAAAVQTPCVAVFSARNLPRVWYPYGEHHKVVYHNVDCQNCNLETCVVEKKKCIMSISVNEVLEAVGSVMQRNLSGLAQGSTS